MGISNIVKAQGKKLFFNPGLRSRFLKILYLGSNDGTSYHRYQALKRLNHDVFLVNPSRFLPSNRLIGKWLHETGAWGFSEWVERKVLNAIRNMHFDLVWVDHGQLLGPRLVKILRSKFKYIINYFHDNLLYNRNFRKWRLYRASIPEYNMLVVAQDEFVDYVKRFGAQRVLRVFRSADEVFFRPSILSSKDRISLSSEVCFVGTWIPERGPFIAGLLKHGIPISIWGDRWHKAKEWCLIKNVWRGPGVFNKDYIKILQLSKICIGLLSTGDHHTTRSIEIPAVGGLFCAKRTRDHMQLYEENREAIFWQDVDECVRVCRELLQSPLRCSEIARRGHDRCLKNNFFNEPILSHIIQQTMAK